MTILDLNTQTQPKAVVITGFLEINRNAIANSVRLLFAKRALFIQKVRKSPEDILAAQQRGIEAQLRVDRLFSNIH